MRYICVNPRLCGEPRALHAYLKDALAFPDYYGMNLDALYDCLTDVDTDTSILALRFMRDDRAVYPFAEAFFRVFRDAAQSNPRLRVDIVELPTV